MCWRPGYALPDRLQEERVLDPAGELGEREEGTLHLAVEQAVKVRVGALDVE